MDRIILYFIEKIMEYVNKNGEKIYIDEMEAMKKSFEKQIDEFYNFLI